MRNKINTALKNRDEILSRFSHAQDLDFGGNVWSTQAPKDPSKKTDDDGAIADAYISAWNLLWDSLTQAGIRSVDEIKDDEIDWQIGNWAGDAGIALLNAKRWHDCIKLNEQILEFDWENDDVKPTDPHSGGMKRSARRDIAECYAELGNIEKSEEKFREYLLADPLWGWGWIGYLQMLEKYVPEKLNQKDDFTLLDGVLGDTPEENSTLLHAARLFIEENPVAMDADMIGQMAEIYQKYGTPEDAAFFVDSYNAARNEDAKRTVQKTGSKIDLSKFKFIDDWAASKSDTGSASSTVRKAPKIGRNDPCPCGSGKKYKKCCGK